MAALQKISTFNLSSIPAKSTIIIGFSGGPDSVYLLHKLVDLQETLGLTLIAAHLDHEWRASSQEDVQFCEELCIEWEVPLIIKKASELQTTFTYNGSQEELGRSMRQFFLEEVRQQHNADCIALGHHQNDQLETFFINLVRGTTITGLVGMQPKNGYFIRPLLSVSKETILNYLAANAIPYHIDPTNSCPTYLRNRIRSKVIPALIECDSRILSNSARALESLKETEQFLKRIVETALKEVTLTNSTGDTCIDLKKFFELDAYLQRRVLKLWLAQHPEKIRCSQGYLEEIMRFLEGPRGGTHRISPKLIITKKQLIAHLSSATL